MFPSLSPPVSVWTGRPFSGLGLRDWRTIGGKARASGQASAKGFVPGIGAGRVAAGPEAAALLLAGVVGRVDERDVRRSDTVYLDQRLLAAGPCEMPVRRRNGHEAADRQLLARALIEFLAHPDEEGSSQHGHVLDCLVIVRCDLVVGREFHAIDERSLLARVTLHDRQPRAGKGRRLDPL